MSSGTGGARPRQDMPGDVADRLMADGVREAYDDRPPYQRNDYLMWIANAKRDATREKRIAQMIEELKKGGVYMKMDWNGQP